jgi:hypothetical protein
MRVGMSDSRGPRFWRVAPYAVPVALLAFAIAGPVHGQNAGLLAIASFGVFNLIGLVPWRQQKPRAVELSFGPGYVDVRRAGTRNQRIRAKDIRGATTARTEKGVLLSLEHAGRDQPITLELDSDAEAGKVRHALGIGHGGFGTVGWRTHGDSLGWAAFFGRFFSVLVAALTIALAFNVSSDAAFIVGMLFGQFALIGSVLGLASLLGSSADRSVVMTVEGLKLKTPRGWFALPYDAVQNIEDHRRGLVFTVPPPYNTVAVERVAPLVSGLGKHDREVAIAQIMSASLRARGLGLLKPEVAGRLDSLRRNGESPRDWLVRLDMAGQMLSAGQGYRGNTLDREDLWAVLEDPEAETELRAAAARVLRHAPDTRVRIDAAVAAVRDEVEGRKLRIAIADDLDSACQELAFLDATEPARRRGMHAPR